MPLDPSKTKKAFHDNIRREVAAGKPVKQAVAIAYREQRLADGGSVRYADEDKSPASPTEARAQEPSLHSGVGRHSDVARYVKAKRAGVPYEPPRKEVPDLRNDWEKYAQSHDLPTHPEREPAAVAEDAPEEIRLAKGGQVQVEVGKPEVHGMQFEVGEPKIEKARHVEVAVGPVKVEPKRAEVAEDQAYSDGGAVKPELHERLVGVVENLFHHLNKAPVVKVAQKRRLDRDAEDNKIIDDAVVAGMDPDTEARPADLAHHAPVKVGVVTDPLDTIEGVALAHGGTAGGLGHHIAKQLYQHLLEHVQRYAEGGEVELPSDGIKDNMQPGNAFAHPAPHVEAPKAPEHSQLDDIEAERLAALKANEPSQGTRLGRALSNGLLGFAGRAPIDFAAGDRAAAKEINAEAGRKQAHYLGLPGAEAQRSAALGDSNVSSRARLLAGRILGDPAALDDLSAQQVAALQPLIGAAVSQKTAESAMALKNAIEQRKLENEQAKLSQQDRKLDQADRKLGIDQQRANSYDYAAHKTSDHFNLGRGDKVTQQLIGVRGAKDVQNAMEATRRAQNAEALLNKQGDLSPAEFALLSQELGNIASGGHPPEAIAHIMAPDTLEGRFAAFKQYLSGAQGSAGLEDLRNAFKDYLRKLEQVSRGTIARHTGTVLKLNKGIRPDLEELYAKNPAFMYDEGQAAFDKAGADAEKAPGNFHAGSEPLE